MKNNEKNENKSKKKPNFGMLCEDAEAVEVHTPEGDRLVKTPDREATIEQLRETDKTPIHSQPLNEDD